MINGDQKIESLQALRGIAFWGIFLSHAGINFSWSKLGVSIFFVLSGFLLSYKYHDCDKKYSFKECVRFSYERTKKLYGLHIVTMIIRLIAPVYLLALSFSKQEACSLVIKTFLNVLLLQTWIPILSVNVSLNGVAWFLSVMTFLYFCFPIIAYHLKECYNTSKLIFASVFVWIFMFLVALCFVNFRGIDGHFFTYLTKCCPLFRLGDFLIGCIWGRILKINGGMLNRIKATSMECVIFTATIVIVIIGKFPRTNMAMKLIWNPTSCYLIFSVMLVVIFFIKQGMITDWIARRKALVKLGDISGEMFLIHYVVIYYFKILQNRLLNDSAQLSGFYKVIIMMIELMITIVCTLLWRFGVKQLKNLSLS